MGHSLKVLTVNSDDRLQRGLCTIIKPAGGVLVKARADGIALASGRSTLPWPVATG